MSASTDPTVQTVTGPVPASSLGRVLAHEHVVLRSPGFAESYPWTFPRREVTERCVDALAAIKDQGISTIVDHTTVDLGRDLELLAEVSQRSGVAIIAATGCHLTVPRFVALRGPEEFADLLVHDLLEGVADTGIRAGVIKCATDRDGVTGPIETVLRACARAHRATGVPISTHTHARSRSGLAQLAILIEEGVAPDRVLIGHSGDTDDLDYLRALGQAGAYLGADRFGAEDYLADDIRVTTVAKLCEAGYASRVMLGHDANVWSDKEPPGWRERVRPRWSHRHLLDDVVPELLAADVTQEDIDRMLIDNPRRFFAAQRPSSNCSVC